MEDIVDGTLRPGQRLTEGDVAASLELGKTPVREALRRLVFEGLVELLPRSGYRIAPVTLRGVEELCGFRLVVEPAAVALAAGRLSTRQLAELDKLATVDYDVANRASIQRFLNANREFHAVIASACGNARLAALVGQVHFESLRIFQVQLINYPDPEQHITLHERLVDALRAGDAKQARRLSEREISSSRDFIVSSLMQSPSLQSVAVSD